MAGGKEEEAASCSPDKFEAWLLLVVVDRHVRYVFPAGRGGVGGCQCSSTTDPADYLLAGRGGEEERLCGGSFSTSTGDFTPAPFLVATGVAAASLGRPWRRGREVQRSCCFWWRWLFVAASGSCGRDISFQAELWPAAIFGREGGPAALDFAKLSLSNLLCWRPFLDLDAEQPECLHQVVSSPV